MNMQITVFGIAILAIACGAIWLLTTPIRRGLKDSRVGRWFVPAILVAIVGVAIGEEVRIAWQFAKFCEDAGVKVYRKVRVEGYLDDTYRAELSYAKETLVTDPRAIESFDQRGYRFLERYFVDGRVQRLERVPAGVHWTVRDTPESKYHYRRHYQPTPHKYEEPVGYKIEKTGELVVDAKTGEVLGRDVRFSRGPSVMEALWIRYLGSGTTQCPDPGKGPPREQLPRASLIPARAK